MYKMRGKIVVISGGTSGIGLATAELLVQDGARVFLVGRDSIKGSSVVEKLGLQAHFIQADLRTIKGCQFVAEQVKIYESHIDALINSAGIYSEERLELVTEASYEDMMNTNVKSIVFLTQAILPLLIEKGGSIVNVASDAGIEGNYGCPLYCASKGAVVALTRALALDYAPKVRVNCVCPGDVETPLVKRQLAGGTYTLNDMAEAYPLGRIGRPEEIAHIICSIASSLNSFMTGSIVNVDGGLSAK